MRIWIPIHPAFLKPCDLEEENDNYVQNENSLKEVLKKADFNKVVSIIEIIDKDGEITPMKAKEVCGKSETTTWRYLQILTSTGFVVKTGNTNTPVYKKK